MNLNGYLFPNYHFLYPQSHTMETPINYVTNEIQQLSLNTKPFKTGKKVRRKQRKKAMNKIVPSMIVTNSNSNVKGITQDEPLSDSECDCTFKITAVHSQNYGKAFRIKKLGCKHMHKSYLNYNSEVEGSWQTATKIYNEFVSKNGCTTTTYVEKENGIISKNAIPRVDKSNLQANTSLPSTSAKFAPKKKKKSNAAKQYCPYWTDREVTKGFANGSILEGVLRINPKNHNEAYVSNQNQAIQDYCLPTVIDRNRALEGDFVAIKVKPEEEWNEKQKTASVVYILQKIHPRIAVGSLLPLAGKKKPLATFIPRDKRVPKIKIPVDRCTDYFRNGKITDTLYKVKITAWPNVDYAEGIITDVLGVSGDLDSELTAIVAEYNVDTKQFPQNFENSSVLPDAISMDEYLMRADFRKHCIFTIDPLTARDLDDAVSCKKLLNGNLVVGVHISDVAAHLIEDTPLDAMVRRKATSVYFVNKVFHMLPEELCQRCSLLPGKDKRAFSVIWEMKPTGEIVHERFVRSVINSCTQLAYEHAQMMIEDPNRSFEKEELPEIHNGYTYDDLSRTVNSLNAIAVQLRQARFDRGALKIDQTKLLFRLDQETGEPLEFFTYENKDAHRLIEEFMLLANISVAQKIKADYPKLAFLRCHDPPKDTMLSELKKNLNVYDFNIDISSSKAIQSSILALQNKLGVPQIAVLNHLLAKPMQRARYFCAAAEQIHGDFSHYALHVPIYTHFTSPIRRYADIMVHRLLSGSLGYTKKPKWNIDTVVAIASYCNRQKYSAKQAGDASSNLFLAHYVEKHQPCVKTAVVFQIRHHSFDVLVHATGSVIRIQEKSFGQGLWQYEETETGRNSILLVFPETSEYCQETVKIEMFETITVNLIRKPNSNALEAQLLRPITNTSIRNYGALET